jgi:hypothetical protein
MEVEERLLIEHFGDAYLIYIRKIKRLIPGIWVEEEEKEDFFIESVR